MENTEVLPIYMEGDLSEVNKLLSRLNIVSAKEVEVFTALTSSKKAVIFYKEALEMSGLKDNEPYFKICMDKFEEAQIAILRSSISGSVLEPSYVRLCNESSSEFFGEVITERILAAELSLSESLPFKSQLQKKQIVIPKKCVKNFSSDFIRSAFEVEKINPLTIVMIPIGEEAFYFTIETLPYLCETCINRMKVLFEKGNIAHILARTIDVTLSEFKDDAEKDDIIVWYGLISKLYAKIEQIRQNQQLLTYPEVFLSTIILNHLLPPKVGQLESRHQLEQHVQIFANTMTSEMSKIDAGLLEQQFQNLMEAILKKLNISEKAESCKEEFLETYVISSDEIEDNNFKSIVKLDQYYIHSSMLSQIISERYFVIEGKLKQYFKSLMKKYLIRSLPPKDFVFFEEEELEVAVRQKVMEYDELYYKILKTPTLLAATIINRGKQSLESEGTSQPKIESVSYLLRSFFDLRTKRLLPWHEIFNLNIPKLGESAYRSLGIFRRLILIFSGRYKNMRTKLRRIRTVNMSLRPNLTKTQTKDKTPPPPTKK